MGRPEYKLPKLSDVIAFCCDAGQIFNITMPDSTILLKEFGSDIPLPFMLSSDTVQLWVDRHYIAYSHFNQDVIHYVYVTKVHIDEEVKAYKRILPKSIESEFSKAAWHMDKTDTDYYFSRKFFNEFSK